MPDAALRDVVLKRLEQAADENNESLPATRSTIGRASGPVEVSS